MHKPWHLLAYIAADNSLYNDALVSLRQITDASLLASIRITVQFDGPSSESSVRYSCEEGKRRLIWAAPDGYPADRAIRLRDFLDECGSSRSDNERIFLVLWGHGAGLDHVYLYNDSPHPSHPSQAQNTESKPKANGFDPRDSHPGATLAEDSQLPKSMPFELLNPSNDHVNRYLKDIQLAQILSAYSHRIGRKIDLLGFDACLMGLAEICHEVSDSVSLIVGSDEELPKGSWPYDTILQDLTHFPGMDASTLSAVVVSRFLERYIRESKHTRISMSAYNLSACESLANKVKGLVQELNNERNDSRTRRKILAARDFSRTPEVTDYVDLGVFCNEIIQSFDEDSPVRHRAAEILSVLVRMPYIFYHRDAAEFGAVVPMGLAIYFPDALPPDASHIETAVRSGRGFQAYSPLGGKVNAHQAQTHGAYRPLDGGSALAVGGMKGLLITNGKTPPDNHVKTPPDNHTKGEVAGRHVLRQLIGSEILWDQYIKLRFNKETGWAKLIEELIGAAREAAAWPNHPPPQPDPDWEHQYAVHKTSGVTNGGS